jgi:hypothetical protein
MATGRRSEQGDAFGVDPEACGVVVDPSDRAFDVPGRLLPARAGGRGKPVVDIEDHVAAASEPSRKQAAAPAALVPPATMDEHDGGMPPAPRTGALWDEPHIQPPHRGGVSAEVGDALRRCRLQPVPNRNQRYHQAPTDTAAVNEAMRRAPACPASAATPKPTPPAAVTTKEHSVSTTPAKYSGWLGPGATISSPPARHNSAHPSATQHSRARGSRRGRGRGRTPPWAGPRRVRSSSCISPLGPTVPDPQGGLGPAAVALEAARPVDLAYARGHEQGLGLAVLVHIGLLRKIPQPAPGRAQGFPREQPRRPGAVTNARQLADLLSSADASVVNSSG